MDIIAIIDIMDSRPTATMAIIDIMSISQCGCRLDVGERCRLGVGEGVSRCVVEGFRLGVGEACSLGVGEGVPLRVV
jgi:hypothetical protein